MNTSVQGATGREGPKTASQPGYRPLPSLPTEWRSLGSALIDQVRRNPTGVAMCDGTGASLTFTKVLVRAIALGRYLGRTVGDAPYVGVLLPPAVPSAVTNLALMLQGKIPVNLNYTAGPGMLDSSIRQCGIRHVITSPRLLEKFQIQPEARLVYLEDVRRQIGVVDKLMGVVLTRFVRAGLLEHQLPGLTKLNLDSVATVIFTSGSTGDPKGVVLTHRNVLSNVWQIGNHIHLAPHEVLLGILPFFHSFGFTISIWTALALGKKVVYHFNPLDARTIGNLCEEHKVTLIAGTPSFARIYARSCQASAFRTLTHLILGAEKLRPELYQQLVGWLNIEPMEGYGATELSPVVTVNLPEEVVLRGGRKIHGNRPGTVGLPLPGTLLKTIDPETGADLPAGAEGVIAVKGPQVMVGYLNQPEATAKVLKDGWYVTGDIGYVDQDGFLKINDRLSRFSKIAGEMVPHLGVEAAIAEIAGIDGQNLAVTAVPDARHGERLCVLYTELGMSPDEIHKALTASRVPRLWIPSVRDFIPVAEIPITGTGKIDLCRLRELALRASAT
jgi:acyl-[acyl-carrier-protein]-phospholipid O-acyltransferase/long-chain-fatty-acid--[acyl-carrier-protein] ligase